jgi:hypothetical protein
MIRSKGMATKWMISLMRFALVFPPIFLSLSWVFALSRRRQHGPKIAVSLAAAGS